MVPASRADIQLTLSPSPLPPTPVLCIDGDDDAAAVDDLVDKGLEWNRDQRREAGDHSVRPVMVTLQLQGV